MRLVLSCAAAGVAVTLGAAAAQAQTIITTQPASAVVAQPIAPSAAVVQPAETVRTTRTVRTVRTLVPVRPPNRHDPHRDTARFAC
jgi:hypothetical protein